MAESAKSGSIAKAQVPVSCHFCNGLGSKWKCEECDVFMCSACKEKVHGKLKSSLSHEVVSIHDMVKDTLVSNEVSSEVVTSIFNSYTTSVPVMSLMSSNDDIVYFLDNSNPAEFTFIKGKLMKASIRILETHNLPIFDFTLNRNDEVLFTNVGLEKESPVRIISFGEVRTVLDPKPMRLVALHINRNDELICGLRENGPAFPLHDFAVRQIVIFGSDYQRKVTLENDTKQKKLFMCPVRIQTDSENVIYVVDWENEEQFGKLVAVDRTGLLKFSYRGPPDIENIRPYGVAVTPKDNIILIDYRNDALHALNTKGILLALQFLNQLNIENPTTICIDNEGFLLVGCYGKGGENGKIHVVKMVEHFM